MSPRRGGENDEDRARTRKRAAAHSTALARIAARHYDEFRAVYAEELTKRGLTDHPATQDAR